MSSLVEISRVLSRKVSRLSFSGEVTHVYNPLEYARQPHVQYLEKYGDSKKQVLLIGMNPGPYGMAQTGVPFGEVSYVQNWLNIKAHVSKPKIEHPKRLIEGFDCKRSEVSGARLWGWAKDRYGTPENFFQNFFVMNYCPLVFMSETGKNFTPDRLAKDEQLALFETCDEALAQTVAALKPKWVIGVGAFAMKRAQESIDCKKYIVSKILHPSPASPMANRGWAKQVEKEFKNLGIQIP